MRGRVPGLTCFAIILANAQELDLPWGTVKRLPSPDGTLILYGKAGNGAPQLWIEDRQTHRRTKLFDVGGTLSAAWSADGTAFYVNDHWASDRERAYLYDAATLQRVDIAEHILAQDPKSRQFANGHAYYEVARWISPDELSVRFFGHTDEPPVRQFDLHYRVSRTGVVQKD